VCGYFINKYKICIIGMKQIFLLVIALIFSLSVPQAFADDFTDQRNWQLDRANFVIKMDTLEVLLGEPVNISCESKRDITSNQMTAKLVIINTINDREFTNDGNTSLTTFNTDKLIRVTCFSIMNDNLSRSELQSTYEFHPISDDVSEIDENDPVRLIPKATNTDPELPTPTVDDSTNDSKKSNGGCSDCTPPTLGYDGEGVKKVDNGVCINDSCMDGGYFHTEYPMQHTTINQLNVISTTYYENGSPSNVSLVQLGIGVKEIGSPINDSQVLIEVYLDYFANDMENPSIKEIILIDPDGIINNATAVISLVPCMENSGTPCLKTDFSYSYGIVPSTTILMSNAIDYDGNVINNYFNDGLAVTDNTIDDVPVLPEIDIVPLEPKCTTSSTQADRNNCQFKFIVSHEINRAQAYLDSIK